jgi:hypothetical protein
MRQATENTEVTENGLLHGLYALCGCESTPGHNSAQTPKPALFPENPPQEAISLFGPLWSGVAENARLSRFLPLRAIARFGPVCLPRPYPPARGWERERTLTRNCVVYLIAGFRLLSEAWISLNLRTAAVIAVSVGIRSMLEAPKNPTIPVV